MTDALVPEKTETADLREIVSQCAAATGAFCSPAASLDFMRLVPGEIIASLKAERRCTAVMAARATAAEAQAAKMREALENARTWHEGQDKSISKQPNANTGHNGWMRCAHQEQIEAINDALASPAQEPQE